MEENNQTSEILDEYLKDLEIYLDDLSLSDRNKIIEEIRQEIVGVTQKKLIPLEKAIQSLGNEKSLVDRYRIQYGHDKAPKPNRRNIFKIVILSLATFTVVGTIAILLLIKSFTPIYEYDKEKRILTLLGGKIVFDEDDNSFFSHTKNFKIKDAKFTANGKLEIFEGDEVEIIGRNVDLRINSTNEAKLRYQCKGPSEISNIVETQATGVKFNLSENVLCLFYVPKDVDVNISAENGFLNFQNLKQNLSVKLKNGSITWQQAEAGIYQLSHDINAAVMKIDKSKFSDKAIYRAYFEMEAGFISIH